MPSALDKIVNVAEQRVARAKANAIIFAIFIAAIAFGKPRGRR